MGKDEDNEIIEKNSIINRLDALISILLEPIEKSSIRYKASRLKRMGLNYKEIAKILGKTESHIAKELTVGKKRGVDNATKHKR